MSYENVGKPSRNNTSGIVLYSVIWKVEKVRRQSWSTLCRQCSIVLHKSESTGSRKVILEFVGNNTVSQKAILEYVRNIPIFHESENREFGRHFCFVKWDWSASVFFTVISFCTEVGNKGIYSTSHFFLFQHCLIYVYKVHAPLYYFLPLIYFPLMLDIPLFFITFFFSTRIF